MRNLAILQITDQAMLALLRGKIAMKVPDNVKIVDGGYSWERGCVQLKLESPSFAPVRDGEWIPNVEFECIGRVA